jgi:hypothetical protein
MAHFAIIDSNNIVQGVYVFDVPDDEVPLAELPAGWYWMRTSYNNRIRKNYAAEGYTYDPVRDAFIAPKPWNSWILNEETCRWGPPVPYPAGAMEAGIIYRWDEPTLSYIEEPRIGE